MKLLKLSELFPHVENENNAYRIEGGFRGKIKPNGKEYFVLGTKKSYFLNS